jgi:hypothetical protein
MNHHRHSPFRLVERYCRGLHAFFNGHGRALAGGTEDEQALYPGIDMKIHQTPHHIFIDPDFLIEGRDYRQQHSANHVLSPNPSASARTPAREYSRTIFALSIPSSTPFGVAPFCTARIASTIILLSLMTPRSDIPNRTNRHRQPAKRLPLLQLAFECPCHR